MRIVVHHMKHYSWEPAPAGVEVTKSDIDSGRAKPAAHGGHLMCVTRESPKGLDHTEFMVPESDIVKQIISVYTALQTQGQILTRREAAIMRISGLVPHHTHRKWMTRFEVHDDEAGNEELFRAHLEPHIDADHGRAPGKNVEPEDVEELVKSYTSCHPDQKTREEHHLDHIHKHFKVARKAKAQ